jgi:ribosome biogenesis protein SSF1/2
MPKYGGRRKKRRTHDSGIPEGATVLGAGGAAAPLTKEAIVPKSIVAKASKVAPPVGELVRDIRKLMSPYTASNLREKRFNRMKDYAAVAGQLAVTHILAVSQTKSNVVFRIGRHPDGPTLHFKVLKYSLARQVRALQKRPYESPGAYVTAPLVVLNNFGQSEEVQVKLMRLTFQHMFPTINTKTVKLSECRRVVLYHYHKEQGTVEMRHYAIRAQPVGVSNAIKRVLQSRVPDLGNLEDIAEFVEGAGNASDSEAEDDGAKVVLPDRYIGKGNAKTQQSAMKLSELGPRITMELFKVEQGLAEGDILYHKFEQKSAAEAAALKARAEKKRLLKAQRKAEQDANVAKKVQAKEEKRASKVEKKRKRLEEGGEADDEGDDDDDSDDDDKEGKEDDGYEGEGGEDQDDEEEYDGEEDDEEEEDEEGEEEEEGEQSDDEEEDQED